VPAEFAGQPLTMKVYPDRPCIYHQEKLIARHVRNYDRHEVNQRKDRATQRRIRAARFPQIKTLEQFKWNWPKKINKIQVQNLFRLNFIKHKSNVVLLGGVGLGKTHLPQPSGIRHV